MTTPEELEGFRRERYFARSWALLTKDRGWIKPVLVMTVAVLVPIVGVLGVIGYLYEWARLTAWGVNAAPKQRGVRIGACIASGWRAFVVALVWTIVSGIVLGIVAVLPVIGPIVSLLWTIINSVLVLVIMVAALRATIYQRIWGGLRVSTIWKMVSHDPGGLARVYGISLLGALIIGAVSSIVTFVALIGAIPQLIYYANYISAYESVMTSSMQAAFALQVLFAFLADIGPAIIVLILLVGFMGTILSMILVTAVGLWMRQFDVASWGREEDPLPPFADSPQGEGATSRPTDAPESLGLPVPGEASSNARDDERPAAPADGAPAPEQAPDQGEDARDEQDEGPVTPLP